MSPGKGQRREGLHEARETLRDPARTLLPPQEAIDAQLHTLARLGRWREISLWIPDVSGRLRCAAHARGKPAGGVAAVARQVHARQEPTPPGPRRSVVAIPLGSPATAGVLAARARPGESAQALELLREASPVLASALERERLLAMTGQQSELVISTERRLARLGLDLHDGPAQHVTALLSDLRLFAMQLGRELNGDPRGEPLKGRLEDLELRSLALEAEIRELARSAGGPVIVKGTVGDILRSEARAFAEATGVVPSLTLRGPVDVATASQRIALLRAVQEALRNIRQHAEPSTVSIRVEAGPESIEAEISDDGRGFDVDRAIARAERRGRLGISGIMTRAELLGGRCEIRSRPGGPTSIRLRLPRWS